MTIELDNTPRGCGTLKKGGCYAIGQKTAKGHLATWYWLLGSLEAPKWGTPQVNEATIRLAVPARKTLAHCPPVTLNHKYVYPADKLEALSDSDRRFLLDSLPEPLKPWPDIGLIDHVGTQHYPTPYAFMSECSKRGPSRRLTPAMARTLAKMYPPYPIFFTHSRVPEWETDDDLQNWYLAAAEKNVGIIQKVTVDDSPTWMYESFIGTSGHDHYVHPSVNVLRAQHIMATSDNPRDDWPRIGTTSEALFGGSWITDIVYIKHDEDDPVPEDLAEAGVQGAIIRGNDNADI